MKRALTTAAVLVAVQALLVVAYLAVRDDEPARVPGERIDRPAPELLYETADGSTRRLSELRGRAVVLHFWATWCGPCREELPALLEFASEREVRVLALSTDPDWPAVRRFFGGEPPPTPVALTSGRSASRDFGVDSLPATFIVDRAGRLRLHFPGPRDWRAEEVREAVLEAAGD